MPQKAQMSQKTAKIDSKSRNIGGSRHLRELNIFKVVHERDSNFILCSATGQKPFAQQQMKKKHKQNVFV